MLKATSISPFRLRRSGWEKWNSQQRQGSLVLFFRRNCRMIEYPWYGFAEEDDLQQGDLFYSCPFDYVDQTGQLRRKSFDVIILSHSCDLAHDKLEMIQVCPFWDVETLAQKIEYFRGKRGREELRRGNLPGYHLLNQCTLAQRQTGFLVIDFRSQF